MKNVFYPFYLCVKVIINLKHFWKFQHFRFLIIIQKIRIPNYSLNKVTPSSCLGLEVFYYVNIENNSTTLPVDDRK